MCTLDTGDKEGDTRGDKCEATDAGEDKGLGEEAATDNNPDTAVTVNKASGAWTFQGMIVLLIAVLSDTVLVSISF